MKKMILLTDAQIKTLGTCLFAARLGREEECLTLSEEIELQAILDTALPGDIIDRMKDCANCEYEECPRDQYGGGMDAFATCAKDCLETCPANGYAEWKLRIPDHSPRIKYLKSKLTKIQREYGSSSISSLSNPMDIEYRYRSEMQPVIDEIRMLEKEQAEREEDEQR